MHDRSLSLLGPFRLTSAGQPLAGFDSAKVRALLAFLAVESARSHSREALAGLLWPEQPERAARHSLSQAISNLRHVLGDHGVAQPCLELARGTVRFNLSCACAVDALAVAELLGGCATHRPHPSAGCAACARLIEQGLACAGGSFLEGLSLPDSPPFEEWAAQRREWLARLVLHALQTLGAHALARGAYEQACRVAQRQIELDPLHEPGHRQLMEAYARTGRRAAGLRQYHECARILDAELGVGPAEETELLYERIKEHGLTPAAPTPTDFAPHESPPRPAAHGEQPLFAGREAELARLDRLLALAAAGQGQVVFVTGETGGGKTALLQEFARRSARNPARPLVASGMCNAHTGRGDPYLPFRELLGALAGDPDAGRSPSLAPAAQAEWLHESIPAIAQAVAEHGPDLVGTFVAGPALVARAGALVSQPISSQAARQSLAEAHGGWIARLEELATRHGSPPIEQARLFEQVSAVLAALAARRPLVLLLDDLQWADAGSASLLFHLGRVIAASPILIVGAYRPEDLAGSQRGARHQLATVVNELRRMFGHTAVNLDRSVAHEGRALVDALLDAEPNALGPAFREALLQQTGGQPLFTVELLRDMQARGDLVRDSFGRWAEGPALDWDTLPARVEGAIAERIARLDEAEREMLLVAAVEGESFTAEVVARVQAAASLVIIRQLSTEIDRRHRLVGAQGVRQVGERRLAMYRFRHILFQRYLYSQLDPVERAYLHEEVGAALELLHAGQTEEIAVQLAHHFHRAGNTAKAIMYLRLAGERALNMGAYEEAIALFGRALGLLAAMPPGPARDQQELALQVARAVPLAGTRGYAHPDVERAYARARTLCRSAGASPELFAALWGLFSYYLVRAEERPMRELAAQLLELDQPARDPALRVVGHWAMGVTLLYVGDAGAALAHLEQMAVFGLAQPATALFATDPGVACHFWTAWALWLLGAADQAVSHSYAALARAEQLAHPFSMAYALFTGTALLQFRREPQAALGWAEATVSLAERHGFSFFHSLGTVFRGWALAEQGRSGEGLALMEAGVAAARTNGARIGLPHMLALLAEAHGRRGDPTRGLCLLDEALAVAHATGERHYEAELHRLRGVLLLAAARSKESAEACLRRAVAVARSQGALGLELRAVTSLCRLLHDSGRTDEGVQALVGCYGRLREGFDTPDVREAQALIEELRPALAA